MSKVHRFVGDLSQHDFSWDGVTPLEINTDVVHGVMKHVLVGPEDEAPKFHHPLFQRAGWRENLF